MKKIQLRVFQAFVMVMLAVGTLSLASCSSDEDNVPVPVTVDGINYILNDDNTATVTVGNYIGAVNIPGAIESGDRRYQVKKIGRAAFMSCTELTAVNIPNTVTYIDNHAFDGCANLAAVTLPANVTYVGSYAFNGCALTQVIIPDAVTVIGAYAYAGNPATYLELGENVNTINWLAFKGCPIQSIDVYGFAPRLDYYLETDEWPFDKSVMESVVLKINTQDVAAYSSYFDPDGGWILITENGHNDDL